MVNGLHLYSAFIQSAVQVMPLIHTLTHQRRLAAMQDANQLVRSNWGLGVSLRVTLRHAQGGIEPATLLLPDDSSYLLSHIAPLGPVLHSLCLCYSEHVTSPVIIQHLSYRWLPHRGWPQSGGSPSSRCGSRCLLLSAEVWG